MVVRKEIEMTQNEHIKVMNAEMEAEVLQLLRDSRDKIDLLLGEKLPLLEDDLDDFWGWFLEVESNVDNISNDLSKIEAFKSVLETEENK